MPSRAVLNMPATDLLSISWVEDSDWVLTPTQTRSRKTLQKILTSARQLFIENSYNATTIAEISKHAGVSSGSIYNLFVDKSAIVRALYEHYRNTREGQIVELLSGRDWATASPLEVVQLHLEIIFSSSREDADFLRLIEERRMADSDLFAIQARSENAFCEQMMTLYQLHRASFNHEDLNSAVSYVHYIIRGSALWSILPTHNAEQFLRVADRRYQAETLRMACAYLGLKGY